MASQERRTKNALCAAFSLIEVSLALMVISVGILAILGLFPMGLDQSSRAVADSHAAQFADEVLNGLRACAEQDWVGLNSNGSISLPAAAGEMFQEVQPIGFTGINVVTNVYTNAGGDIVNHALRYRLEMTSNGNIKAAALRVWGGQYGATSAPSVFYAEFFRYVPQ